MTVVEKAAAKLRALKSETPPETVVERAAARTEPVVESLQQQRPVAGEPAPADALPWHVDETLLQQLGFSPADDDAGWRLTDELRRIKRPLLDNVGGNAAKPPAHAERIVVTSAVPGEGKTFTAMNLALSLACERDYEVLLVDGDIPKSDVTQILGLEGRPGLMDVLVDDQRDPAEVVVRTDIPDLLVVPAGNRHPLTAELFGSRRMEKVLKSLAATNGPLRRLLVFDSPPLLATSESRTLLSHMGQVVMVVVEGRTRQQEVRLALENASNSQYVGLVLNMSRHAGSENHSYGYYGRYYGVQP